MNTKAEPGLNCSISGVQFHEIPYIWPKVEGLIARVLSHDFGEYELEDIYQALLERDMQLWVAWTKDSVEAMMLTQIINFPRKRYLYIIGLAGDTSPERWKDGWAMIEKWAMEQELDGIRAPGRPGWERHPLSGFVGLKKRYVLFGNEFVSRRLQ